MVSLGGALVPALLVPMGHLVLVVVGAGLTPTIVLVALAIALIKGVVVAAVQEQLIVQMSL